MKSSFEKVLIDALDALEEGEDVGTILAQYPEHEAELRPILLTATTLSGVRVAHSLEAQAASRQRMLEYAAAATPPANHGSSLLVLLRRLSLAMATLLIIFALLGTGVLFASSETIPGDALYDAKRFFEDTRLSFTNDTEAREALQKQYEEARIREIKTLLRMGRSEDVVFTGIIESIDGDLWLVAGIEVIILDSTTVTGGESPAAGYLVQIEGMTTNGRVNAEMIVIRSIGNVPEPAPEPSSTETPTPTPTPTNTPTPTPTATNTPVPTPTATTEEAVPVPPPTPTATPSPESNENGNANDNENEGGGNANENEAGAPASQNSNVDGEDESNENNDNDDDDDDREENENRNGNDSEENENRNDNHNDNDNKNST